MQYILILILYLLYYIINIFYVVFEFPKQCHVFKYDINNLQ